MRPGSSVVSPRSMTRAPVGCVTEAPTARMRSPSTSTSPGVTRRPESMSSKCAACRTMGTRTAGSAVAFRAGIASAIAVMTSAIAAIAVTRLQPMAGCRYSIHLKIAILQRDHPGFVADFVAQIQQDEHRNHQVTGDEIEPGEYRGLEHADVGAEQHHQEQHQRQPRAVGVELGFELQVIEAAALRDPGLAETQVADGYPQPNDEAAQARGIVEDLVDFLVADHGREKRQRADRPGREQRRNRYAAPVEPAEHLRRLAAV